MRRRLKFHFVGTLLLMSHVAHAFILLTASMDDVKRIAKKFVSESLADKITDMLAKASEQMNTNLSKENEQNEDEFENISNELLTNFKLPSKDAERQRFKTKSERVEDDNVVLATDTTLSDRSNTFMESDAEQMNEVSKEKRLHNVDFDKPKPAYQDEDRLIDKEFGNDFNSREIRGNLRMNKDKQDNELGQDNTDHELENVRFDHQHEINEYKHESEKPTNDFDLKFNKQSKEESEEAGQPGSGSERYIGQKNNIGSKRDSGPKRDIAHKKDIAPEKDIGPKKYTESRKPIEKNYENESQSSDEQKSQDDSDAKSSEGKMYLRQAIVSTTSEKSKYIEFMHTTKKTQASSDKPKEKKSLVKRPHHRLADSKEINEDVLMPGNAVTFLKKIDERDYNEKAGRRGSVYMQNLLATSGPIALPKISNIHVDKDTSLVENESWI